MNPCRVAAPSKRTLAIRSESYYYLFRAYRDVVLWNKVRNLSVEGTLFALKMAICFFDVFYPLDVVVALTSVLREDFVFETCCLNITLPRGCGGLLVFV